MSMIVPEALRDLVGRWRANGSPTQPGIGWARQKWVGSFPEQRAELGGLPDLLDRASVQRFCLGAATDAQSAETAFVAIMTWGFGTVGYGRWRTQRILTDTPNSSARLAAVARTLAEDGASAAYERLASHKDCGLRGLGPAFGTKYIYFIQPRDQAVRALIFDRLVADWLGRETNLGLSAGAWSVATYARYLDAMHAWASSLGCQPDDVETCIFRAMATERGNQWGRAHPPQATRAPLLRRKGEFAVNDFVIGSRVPLDKLSLPSRPRPRTPASEKGGTVMWNDVRTDIYLRLIEAAIGGHTIAYSDVLPNAPRQVGPHLYPIADYEKAHRRPPLTALVVHKQGRRPGEGFATVADHITYRRPGESDRDVWERACAEVFAYWRP